VVRVYERFQFFNEHPSVKISLSARFVLGVLGRRVFVNAILAVVIDAHDNQGLDLTSINERLRRFIYSPFLTRNKRGGIKEILAVMQIKHGVMLVLIFIVIGR